MSTQTVGNISSLSIAENPFTNWELVPVQCGLTDTGRGLCSMQTLRDLGFLYLGTPPPPRGSESSKFSTSGLQKKKRRENKEANTYS